VDLSDETFFIRPFDGTEADWLAVLEVYRQCEDFLALGPVPTASLEMVQNDLKLSKEEGGTFNLICSVKTGEVWGIVDYVTAGFQGDPQLAFLSLLMIAAPYRGKGLGAEVVRKVEQTIREDGRAQAIQSGVQVNNPQAIRFWQRMGYSIVSAAELLPDSTVCYRLWKAV
jgi:ribosomal protein S18 acetylase RimI-like enzyme